MTAHTFHTSGCRRCEHGDPEVPLPEQDVRDLLFDYDHLVDQARAAASYAFRLRHPKWYLPSFDISFDEKRFYASWYAHGDNNQEEFPLHYLWATHAEIEAGEVEEAAAQKARAAAQQKKLDDERERRERASLKVLLERYPDARNG